MVFILFDFILSIPVNNFSVMSAHSTKIKMRGSREGVAEGPDFLPGKSETFKAPQQDWSRSPGKSKATNWVIIAPPAFCCWADDGPLLVVFRFLTPFI